MLQSTTPLCVGIMHERLSTEKTAQLVSPICCRQGKASSVFRRQQHAGGKSDAQHSMQAHMGCQASTLHFKKPCTPVEQHHACPRHSCPSGGCCSSVATPQIWDYCIATAASLCWDLAAACNGPLKLCTLTVCSSLFLVLSFDASMASSAASAEPYCSGRGVRQAGR